MKRKCKFIALLLLAAAMGYIIGGAAFLFHFPSQIRLTEFATHHVNIGLPLNATFSGETTTVALVNQGDVSYDLSTRVHRPLTIKTNYPGMAEMTIEAFGVPIRRIVLDVVPEVDVIPMGTAIGVRINTDGVMVLGTGSFKCQKGESHSPTDNLLEGGDLILSVNGAEIKSKEDLGQHVADSAGDILFVVRRNDMEIEVTVSPVVAYDGVRRIGAWVRDSTKGIGTLTFYSPRTGSFGALGHGIMDVDTNRLMSVQSGVIMPSTVTDVKRGARGFPGELEGTVNTSVTLGAVEINSPSGIYGTLDPIARAEIVTREPMPIGLRSQIQEGKATILTNVSGSAVKEYEISIENVNPLSSDETKGMVIRITDPELLKITGGIVQGMSGSPILQNGRIIGAVTHVFVQDPTKGYGIFIENMLNIK